MAGPETFIFYASTLLSNDIETLPGPNSKRQLDRILQQRGINILHQNIRGLLSSFANICKLIDTHRYIDILTLLETHICDEENIDELNEIPGHKFINRHRTDGKDEDVAIYVKDSINFERRFDLEGSHLEYIVIEIFIKANKTKTIIISNCYQPPETSDYFTKNFNELFNESLSLINATQKEVILLGDMNVNYLKPKENKEFKSMLYLHGFTKLITKPTRIIKDTQTLIDIIAKNSVENISHVDVIAKSLSDHDLVVCVRKMNHKRFLSKTIRCRDYKSYDSDSMNRDFSNADWQPILNETTINISLNLLNENLTEIFNQRAKIIEKKVKGRKCPWIDNDIKKLMNVRDQVLRKARKAKSENDWSRYKILRNQCNNLLKRNRSQYNKNLIEENSLNPKKLWTCVKDVFPTKQRVSSQSSSKPKSKVMKFSEYFSTIVNSLKKNAFLIKDCVWQPPIVSFSKTSNTFKFQYLSVLFVKKHLKKLKRNKAAGLDDLPPAMLEDSCDYIAKPLCHIINLSLTTSTVPSE